MVLIYLSLSERFNFQPPEFDLNMYNNTWYESHLYKHKESTPVRATKSKIRSINIDKYIEKLIRKCV